LVAFNGLQLLGRFSRTDHNSIEISTSFAG